MKFDSKTRWDNFKKALKKNIELTSTNDLEKLNAYSDRKYFFKNHLLSKIANDMELTYRESEEFLRVDYTLFSEFSNGEKNWKVPIIFIESENDWEAAYEESIKLASLNAPLKILILYGLTDERQKSIDESDNNWDYILEEFLSKSRLIGYFVVLICSIKDMNITFHAVIYDESGKVIDREEIEIEKFS